MSPTRTCRICRKKQDQGQLQRWVKTATGLAADSESKQPGRGFYSCSPECAERLQQISAKIKR